MTTLIAFIVGLVFGFGLLISGMANPAKVLGFLDLAGTWDPSLAFVMGGAIVVGVGAFRIATKRSHSLLNERMQIPNKKELDRNLLIGSALFGIGWGIAGICPGPAIVLLGTGSLKGAGFVLALLGGMALFEYQQRWQQRRQQ